jgi:hypothetical protein
VSYTHIVIQLIRFSFEIGALIVKLLSAPFALGRR